MPRESSEAWQEVAKSVTDLGLRIREHYRERVVDRGEPELETRHSVSDSLEVLGLQLSGAMDAVGEAFHDPMVRDQAVRASRAFADAVEASLSDVGSEVKQAGGRIRQRRDR
jgi:hypothetical protein